jgi:hypothetical protein
MKMRNWLAVAEAVDSLRIFPRVMLIGYGCWVIYFVGRIMQFYFDLADSARTPEVTAFSTIVIGAVTGFAAPIFTIYNNSARDWTAYNAGRGGTSETVIATTKVTSPGG